MSSIFVNSYSHKFTPYSVPSLRAWFDDRFGVYSVLAIPDSSATVNGTGFPVNFSNTNRETDSDNNLGYTLRPNSGGRSYGVVKIGNVWKYAYADSDWNDSDGSFYYPFVVYTPEIVAIGDTQYPWQATWPSGISVTRNGTETGTLATYNQKVVRWENTLNRNEAFIQPNISSQPTLLNGIYFNGNNMLQYIPQNTQSIQWNSITYYLVFREIATLASLGGTIIRANVATTSRSSHRFAVGASYYDPPKILVNHSNANYLDSGVTYVDSFGTYNRIYSIEFENTGSRIYAKVYDNIYATPNSIDVGSLATLQTRFLLGASTTTGSQGIYGSFSHVLIYYNKHTQEQRVKIMKYLKDNTNNGYATEIEF